MSNSSGPACPSEKSTPSIDGSAIDPAETLRLAALLHVSVDGLMGDMPEAEALARDLDAMRRRAESLAEVDTEGVAPLFHFADGSLRDDIPGAVISPDDLAWLPAYEAETSYFNVPAIFKGDI